MVRPRCVLRGLAVALTLSVLSTAVQARERGEWCRTFELWKEKRLAAGETEPAQGDCPTEGSCDDPVLRDSFIPDGATPIRTVRLLFHVFAEDDGQNPVATEIDVKGQVSRLNADFAASRIQFTYRMQTIHSTLYRYFTFDEDAAMKAEYALDPVEQLNIYVAETPGYSYAIFPWDPDALNFRGGVVVAAGGFGAGWSLLTHEVGHCLGLWHTHHGVSEVGACTPCYERIGGDGDVTGDFASDTAPTPINFRCADPQGIDACTGLAWVDTNWENFMGYALDGCRTSFSAQQMGRKHCWFDDVLTGWSCDNVVGLHCCGDGTCESGENFLSCPEDCPACVSCTGDAECDDGEWCNGSEVCGQDDCCAEGIDPCPGQACIESTQTCVDCLTDADCDDGSFCNGMETCSAETCFPGTDPCPGGLCDDGLAACVSCLADDECDDGVFCNGLESCTAGECRGGVESCPGMGCDEGATVCLGNVSLQPAPGMPLLGLTPAEQSRFLVGRAEFDRAITEPTGLGPVYNEASCASCHDTPARGASGSRLVAHFGFHDAAGGTFDPLESLGGSLHQDRALSPPCLESIPGGANVVQQRLPPTLQGAGLVEAIPDADLQVLADSPPGGVSGRVHVVTPLEAPGATRAGRFGWKSQQATLLSMSAAESLDQLGRTNRLLTTDHAPNGDPVLLAQCDAQQDPEDVPTDEGDDYIGRVTGFARFLAPPPQTPRSGMSGEVLFNLSGCQNCHKARFVTPDDPALEAALRDRELKPYSDFLLHDMGDSGEYVEQGDAAQGEVRTPPLWGLTTRDSLWHDGRIAGATFFERILAAIQEHDVPGSEARATAQALLALPTSSRDAVVDFLASLGRLEFDHDGDHDVDVDDYVVVQACFTGEGSFYTADDPCSISDVDQDGDVDDDDLVLFQVVARGEAGRVPNGADAPGIPLTVARAAGEEVTLNWGGSCLSSDLDYEIYQGTIGDFTGHASRFCTTDGATSLTFWAFPGSYFLVVPSNGFREGSYGTDGDGNPRARPAAACLPQAVGACQ